MTDLGTSETASPSDLHVDVCWLPEPVEGALGGVRVLDLSRVLAGPYLTMMLGDLGADVIKVERPEGDDTRAWGPPYYEGQATYFLSVNRNKRATSADLRVPAARDRVIALALDADVVVENFRPGVADRLGLGYEALRAVKRDIVYCSINAFGSAPEAAALPGYDLLVQAVGGLMSLTGTEDSGPFKAGVAVVDVLAGLHGSTAVLAALRHRDQSGAGQHIEISLLGTLLSSLVNHSTAYVATGVAPRRVGNAHPSIAPYQTLQCADGVVAVAVGNDKQFRTMCTTIGLADLPDDARYATNPSRVANRETLVTELESTLRDLGCAHVVTRLLAAGVPAGPVNDLAGAFDYAEALGLDAVVTADDVPMVANPMRLSQTPPTYRLAPPRLPDDEAAAGGHDHDPSAQ